MQLKRQGKYSDSDVLSTVNLDPVEIGQKLIRKEAMGVAAELILEAKLIAKGFIVSVPTLSCPYDLLCDSESAMNKIQVKSSNVIQVAGSGKGKYYRFRTSQGSGYSILACYVVPTDTFYFIPWQVANKRHTLNIPLCGKRATIYDEYKENYAILEETH